MSQEDIIDVVGNTTNYGLPPGLLNGSYNPRSRIDKHNIITNSSAFRPVFQPLITTSTSREQSYDSLSATVAASRDVSMEFHKGQAYDSQSLSSSSRINLKDLRSRDQSMEMSMSVVHSREHSFDSKSAAVAASRDVSVEYHKAQFFDSESLIRSSSITADRYNNISENRLSIGSNGSAGDNGRGSSFDLSSSANSSADFQSSFGSPVADLNSSTVSTHDLHNTSHSVGSTESLNDLYSSNFNPMINGGNILFLLRNIFFSS